MSWTISGIQNAIELSVSGSGFPICSGEGEHELWLPNTDRFKNESHIEPPHWIVSAKCLWVMALPDDDPIHYDGAGMGLLRRVTEDSSKTHGMAIYHKDSKTVVMNLVVPSTTFMKMHRLFELVLSGREIRYSITLDSHSAHRGADYIQFPSPDFSGR